TPARPGARRPPGRPGWCRCRSSPPPSAAAPRPAPRQSAGCASGCRRCGPRGCARPAPGPPASRRGSRCWSSPPPGRPPPRSGSRPRAGARGCPCGGTRSSLQAGRVRGPQCASSGRMLHCSAGPPRASLAGWRFLHGDAAMSDPRLESLRRAVPGLRLATAPEELQHYGRDWTRRWTPAPLAVALPADAAEVQAVMRWASAPGVPVVPSGGRTGLSGGAVAARGELVLSLERMRRVLAFDPVDRTLAVEAGTPLETVQEAAREHGLQYPVDFASRGSCTIGGNIATNAGGIRVLRYGNTREWVARLKLVTARGELLDLNRGLVKNSSGYDLRHLVIASEGTLGIVVEATLRLAPPPPPVATLLLALPSF